MGLKHWGQWLHDDFLPWTERDKRTCRVVMPRSEVPLRKIFAHPRELMSRLPVLDQNKILCGTMRIEGVANFTVCGGVRMGKPLFSGSILSCVFRLRCI